MNTCCSVTIRGDLDRIFAYAAEVERWPEILPHYRNVRILEVNQRARLVSMHCVRPFGPLHWPCKWRARQQLLPAENRILFTHVSGPAKGMEVEWSLNPTPEGVETTIKHWTDLRRPGSALYWDRVVGPLFVQPIAMRTLATIKHLIEGNVTR